MPISTLSNITSMNVARNLGTAEMEQRRAMERLSSGRRINHGYDDAAGLAISSSLTGKIRSLQQAQKNTENAISLIQTAEGGLTEIDDLLVRIRELAVQGASNTMGDRERDLLNMEVYQLREEIGRLSRSSKYMGTNLLNGMEKELIFQVGIENTENDRMTYQAGEIDVTPEALGIENLSLEDQDDAFEALETVDEAIQKLQDPRAHLGAIQTRLHSMLNSQALYEESLSQANSRIMETDYAKETTNLFLSQVHLKAGVALLAQANQMPAQVLKLLDPSG